MSRRRSQLPDRCATWAGTQARILLRWSFPKSLIPSILLVIQLYGCRRMKHRAVSPLLSARGRGCSVRMLPPSFSSSQQLAKGLHDLPWHVQEAFGGNERQNQGLNNLQVCAYPQNLAFTECSGVIAPFCPHTAPYSGPFMASLFLTAFQAGVSILLSAKASTAVKELTDSC